MGLEIKKEECKGCRELRILNKKGFCIFCTTEFKHGTNIKSKTGYIDENKYFRV